MSFEPVERIDIATITRNKREELRVELLRMQDGRWRFSARVWYREADVMKPARDGFTLSIDGLAEFADAVSVAMKEAHDRALIMP